MIKVDTKSHTEKPVVFRYIGVPHGLVTVGGIGLWYLSAEDAKEDFVHFQNYIVTSNNLPRRCSVSFDRDTPETYCLNIEISYSSAHYRILINQVEACYVQRVCDSLSSLPYIFIMAGYTDESGQENLLPPSEYNFFVSVLRVNGKQVRGNKNNPWPLEIFKPGPANVVKEEFINSER
jgi:hypothetical protein